MKTIDADARLKIAREQRDRDRARAIFAAGICHVAFVDARRKNRGVR